MLRSAGDARRRRCGGSQRKIAAAFRASHENPTIIAHGLLALVRYAVTPDDELDDELVLQASIGALGVAEGLACIRWIAKALSKG